MPDATMLRKVIYEATSLKPMALYGNYVLHDPFFKVYRTRQPSANGGRVGSQLWQMTQNLTRLPAEEVEEQEEQERGHTCKMKTKYEV
jgi:hypothetical protein